MRLLLVTDAYPPLIGGADRQVQMLAAAMRSAGHAVVVATPWQPGLPEHEDDAGVAVHRLRSLASRLPGVASDPARRHHPPFPDPAVVLGLRRIVREHRPDLVHSYGWISYSAAAALLRSRIPLVLSARDYGAVCGVRNYLYVQGRVCDGPAPLKCLRCAASTYTAEAAGNAVLGASGRRPSLGARLRGAAKGTVAAGGTLLLRPLLRRNLAGLHSVSSFVQAVMDRHLLDGHPVAIDSVIPSFLPPTEPGEPDAALLASLPSDPYLLYVGALLPQKGIWPLLAAYEALRAPAPPLVLLGPSSWKSPTALPPGVVAPGATSHATVMAAWDRALFGVVPSVGAETFGNVVTEAMSQGRPVVASRLGGITDIVEDGQTGLLVAPGDAAALAEAMQRLIDRPALRERLGARARVDVQRFAARPVIARFEALYRDAIAAGPGGRRKPRAAQPAKPA